MEKLTQPVNLERETEVAISIKKLSFAYPQQPEILQELSLEILPGEKVGLIGGNGAGKTTLFLLVCGILSPYTGEIILVEKPVVTGEFRPEIGLVFQNPSDQLFCPSVRDDVAFGPENMGLSPAEVEKRVEEALSTTGVLKLSDRVPHQLSGGEKCMVAIATVLAMRPQIILYDEPSANLDLGARRRLIEFLQQSSQTIVISSHDLELILEVCDRVVLLDRGKIIADGQPKEIMGDRDLMETHGLEKPHSLLPHPFFGD
ncbi:energy-coupling factor ABC transporter ATP-binding protein [Oscillatoria salina]|uniref:energy-coupling factor ABC transporter ATP-binding protein n=1 Tax=Oscillatoria salina TaxID=331517 RepID=UPI001CCD95FF|nr:ABC transporter ATP-binding protein [Oscillatoria salina]MBZ8180089.1 ABC transporter ATP-binding protein [Oscillatoria salina IIICB1]